MEILESPAIKKESPFLEEGFEFSLDRLTGLEKSFPKEALVQQLLQYNEEIGLSEKTKENILKLKNENVFAVVGGQQLGFLGGPLYTFYKAITILLTAKKYGLIPIFWIASEDHDIREIDHATFIDDKGNLLEKRLKFKNKGFVEDLIIEKKHLEVIQETLEFIGKKECVCFFKENELFSKSMASLFAVLFKEEGLIFIEPYRIRALAKNVFLNEAKRAAEVVFLFQEVEKQFQENALEYPLNKREPFETHIFVKDDLNQRTRVKFEGQHFFIGEKKLTQEEFFRFIEENPEKLSPDVALRPIVQSAIIPTAIQIVGPNELAYYSALKPYFKFHQKTMPSLVPRVSCTLFSKEIKNELELLDSNVIKAIQKFKDRSSLKNETALPKKEIHHLTNLFFPKEELQERVLNFWQFQKESKENLISSLLKALPISSQHHYYSIFENHE